MQIPPGQHVRNSRVIHIALGKPDLDRTDHINQEIIYPEIAKALHGGLICLMCAKISTPCDTFVGLGVRYSEIVTGM